jgi:hypothetical protein
MKRARKDKKLEKQENFQYATRDVLKTKCHEHGIYSGGSNASIVARLQRHQNGEELLMASNDFKYKMPVAIIPSPQGNGIHHETLRCIFRSLTTNLLFSHMMLLCKYFYGDVRKVLNRKSSLCVWSWCNTTCLLIFQSNSK